MKLAIILIEAIVIIGLLLLRIYEKWKMGVFLEQAERVKKRQLDIDDIEVGELKDTQAALADAINVIKNNMQTFLESTKGNVVVLSDAIDVLSEGADQNRDGSRRIAESLAMVVEKVEDQLELVKSCLDLIENNSIELSAIDGSVKEIGDLLSESVDSCKNGVQSLEHYEMNMNAVSEDLDKSEKILLEFGSKIGEINDIGSFIVSISSSLQMLALNASIEAARVGAAGSGFAVVAREMGVMSEKTQEGIDTINKIVANIIDSSNQVQNCIKSCVDVFDQSRQEFDAVSGSFRTIDKQSRVINDKMKGILSKIDEIADNSKVTKDRAHEAYEISSEITSGTQEISSISEQTSEASSRISHNVDSLDNMLNGLEQLLRQFRTSVEPVKTKAGKKVKIGVFCIVDNDFWRGVRRGTIYAIKELEACGAEIRYYPFYQWGTVYQDMNARMDEMLADDFDGFIMPGFMMGNIEDKVALAISMGKRVFSFNCDIENKKLRTAVFQPDVAEGAVLAAKAMEKALKKNSRIVVLEGGREVAVNAIRSDSFQKYFSESTGTKVVDVLHVDYEEEETYRQTLEYLKEHKDVDGLFLTTGTPLAAARAIEDSKRKVKLVVFDHSQEIFRYIKRGIIVGAIGQDPFGQGHDPLVWMYNSVVTGQPLPSDNMKCRSNVVDKNNVDSLVEV